MDDIAGCCLLIILIPVGLCIAFVGLVLFAVEGSSGLFVYFFGASIVLVGLLLSFSSIYFLYATFKEA